MTEYWCPIIGFEAEYSISDQGRVRRDASGHGARVGRILKPGIRNGYPSVSLHRPGVIRKEYVHALVAEAYIGKRGPGEQVNHIDGNKLNADVTNLEYVTSPENISHAIAIGLSRLREQRSTAKLSMDAAREIRRLAGFVSQNQLARRFGVCRGTVLDVLNGRTWADQFPEPAREATSASR